MSKGVALGTNAGNHEGMETCPHGARIVVDEEAQRVVLVDDCAECAELPCVVTRAPKPVLLPAA